MQKLTELIREDMKPALGVTEPGAIAFAVASAKKYTEGKIVNVHVALNSGRCGKRTGIAGRYHTGR